MKTYIVIAEHFDIEHINRLYPNHSHNYTSDEVLDAINSEEHGEPHSFIRYKTQADAYRGCRELCNCKPYQNGAKIIGGTGMQVLRTVWVAMASCSDDDYDIFFEWAPACVKDMEEIRELDGKLAILQDNLSEDVFDQVIDIVEEIDNTLPELQIARFYLDDIRYATDLKKMEAGILVVRSLVDSWFAKFEDQTVQGLEFKDAVRNARQSAGLTQAEASIRMNIPKRTLENWEAGKSVPPQYVQGLVLEKYDRI